MEKQTQLKMSVLLVEEDACVRDALRRFFLDKGYWVTDLETSESALTLLRYIKFHLVVAEFELLGMDGLSFLRLVCRNCPGTKKILLTPHGETELINSARDLELCKVVEKPLNVNHLITALSDSFK